MKLLIIGGTGVLSTAFTKEAIKSGWDVSMVNRGNHMDRIPSHVRLIKSDRENYSYIREQLAGDHFDVVIDFLCFTQEQLKNSFSLYSKYADQYVFISSTCVVDNRQAGVLDEDSAKPFEQWSYSTDKWNSELLLHRLSTGASCQYTIVRPCITYDDTRIPYGITPKYGYHWTLIERARAGKPIITWNNGRNRWNMMRVEDFACALVGLAGNERAYGKAINICGDETPSFAEVLRTVESVAGISFLAFDIPPKEYSHMYEEKRGEIMARSYDSINSNLLLKQVVPGFAQRIRIEEGIDKTIKSYMANDYQKGIDWAYDAASDRIIRDWCKKKGLDRSRFIIGFVDYFGNASFRDRLTYWEVFNQNNLIVRLIRLIRLGFVSVISYAQRVVRK